jgi:dihydrofolate reductase
MSQTWKAIAAMSLNRVIGNNREIPWRIAEDWRWVSETTRGGVLVMGRRTFESIGRPLPKRENIVISRTMTAQPGITVMKDLSALDQLPEDRDIWVFGGAQIYSALLPRCSDLYLTVVNRIVDGDTWFPPFEEEFDFKGFIRREEEFLIKHYVRHDR